MKKKKLDLKDFMYRETKNSMKETDEISSEEISKYYGFLRSDNIDLVSLSLTFFTSYNAYINDDILNIVLKYYYNIINLDLEIAEQILVFFEEYFRYDPSIVANEKFTIQILTILYECLNSKELRLPSMKLFNEIFRAGRLENKDVYPDKYIESSLQMLVLCLQNQSKENIKLIEAILDGVTIWFHTGNITNQKLDIIQRISEIFLSVERNNSKLYKPLSEIFVTFCSRVYTNVPDDVQTHFFSDSVAELLDFLIETGETNCIDASLSLMYTLSYANNIDIEIAVLDLLTKVLANKVPSGNDTISIILGIIENLSASDNLDVINKLFSEQFIDLYLLYLSNSRVNTTIKILRVLCNLLNTKLWDKINFLVSRITDIDNMLLCLLSSGDENTLNTIIATLYSLLLFYKYNDNEKYSALIESSIRMDIYSQIEQISSNEEMRDICNSIQNMIGEC